MEDPIIFSKKLEVGMKTKSTENFLIIARLESLIAGLGMNETMMRAEKYINAGVDGIMIHSKLKEPSEVLEFIPKFEELCNKLGRRPYLIAVPTTYNIISDDELINLGVDIIIHANHLLRASYKSMIDTATLISKSRRSYEADPAITSVKEIFSAVGYDKIIERDKEKSPDISGFIASAGDYKINNTQRSLNKILGKPLISHQIETFKKAGIEKIKITVNNQNDFDPFFDKDINLIETKDIKQNQMLDSIMAGLEDIKGPVILTYGDILFNEKIISELIAGENDIVIAADSSYKYHKHEIDKKLELVSYKDPDNKPSRRKLKMTDTFEVKKVSKNLNLEEAQSEFFGLAYFSSEGIINLKSCYQEIKEGNKSRFFIDILNFMIQREIKVFCIEFDGGWIELHTENDFELAEKELEN